MIDFSIKTGGQIAIMGTDEDDAKANFYAMCNRNPTKFRDILKRNFIIEDDFEIEFNYVYHDGAPRV